MAKRKKDKVETESKSSGSGMDYRHAGHISNKQLKLWATLAPTPEAKRVFTDEIKLHKHHA